MVARKATTAPAKKAARKPRKAQETTQDPPHEADVRPGVRMNRLEVATLFKMSEQNVELLVKKGIISPPIGMRFDSYTVVSEYVSFLRQNQKMGTKAHAKVDQEHDFELSAKARLEKAKADMAELNFKQAEGQLIEIDKLADQLDEITQTIRARLLNIPAKAATLLVGEDDPDIVFEQVEGLIHEALTELADGDIDAGELPAGGREAAEDREGEDVEFAATA